jgi:hypothetical protein
MKNFLFKKMRKPRHGKIPELPLEKNKKEKSKYRYTGERSNESANSRRSVAGKNPAALYLGLKQSQ